jgi:hypothetical protein
MPEVVVRAFWSREKNVGKPRKLGLVEQTSEMQSTYAS